MLNDSENKRCWSKIEQSCRDVVMLNLVKSVQQYEKLAADAAVCNLIPLRYRMTIQAAASRSAIKFLTGEENNWLAAEQLNKEFVYAGLFQAAKGHTTAMAHGSDHKLTEFVMRQANVADAYTAAVKELGYVE